MDMKQRPFWKEKSLHEMTPAEWEALCSRCGICCLNRFRDGKTGKVFFTRIACRFLNLDRCICTVYGKPFHTMPSCGKITAGNVHKLRWLPATCGYRSVAEGRDLQWWHPLISGDPDTVHEAGVSIRNKAVSERSIALRELEAYMMKTPNTVPWSEGEEETRHV